MAANTPGIFDIRMKSIEEAVKATTSLSVPSAEELIRYAEKFERYILHGVSDGPTETGSTT